MAEVMKETSAVNRQALWDDLMKIAEFTEKNNPYTRRSFSPLFVEARKWLAERFIDAGMSARVDTGGNLIGLLQGTESGAGTIMLGSHSDTVLNGGRFDGVAGVIAALEIARALTRERFRPRHNIEIVDFLAEEPNPYGLSCVGSRAMAGQLTKEMLDYNEPGGETLGQAISRIGGDAARIADARRSDIKAFFELHIEQGPILEAEQIDIGLVTSIVGITRIEVIFEGEADHAGTTPMSLRRDAAAAAADILLMVRNLASKLSQKGRGHFVATTGVVDIVPNAMNVVPERARIVIDARSEDKGLMAEFLQALDVETLSAADRYRVERTSMNRLSETMAALCHPELRALLDGCARKLGLTTRTMASGAGHDAAFISRIAPAAMVFVPCLRGKSHAAEEWAEPEALGWGAEVVAQGIMQFDAQDKQ